MSKRNEYFGITKEGETFVVKTLFYYTFFGHRDYYNAEFRFSGIKDLEACGDTLVFTEQDGTYSLYYLENYKPYEWRPKKSSITGILNYQYFNGKLLLKKADYYIIFNPKWYFGCFYHDIGQTEMDKILEKREERLDKIYANEVTIREDFNYKCFPEYSVFINVDGTDYYVYDHCYSDGGIEPGDKIFKLGKAESLPGNNGCIKVISAKGEYIFEGYMWQLEEPKYYNKVVPFVDEDYTAMHEFLSNLKKKLLYGYWFKDENGTIERMALYPKYERFEQYEIVPPKPAKSIEFVKHNEEYDVWRITYPNNEEEILLFGHLVTEFRIYLDPKDLSKK